MAKVFVSYRREDSAPYAGRICDRLEAAVGADHVFIDVEDIRPGMDFAQTIEQTVGKCHVLVAVIGPKWLETLRARDQDQDYVEHEIAAALERGIEVIPVLVGGASMPAQRDLPPRIAKVARRHAVTINDSDFNHGAAELARAVNIATSRARSPKRLLWGIVAAGVLIAVLGATVLLMRSRERASLDGTWIARMQRPGQRPYNIRLRLLTTRRTVTGGVDYPTGSAPIQGGTVENNRIAFSTTHTPQFESTPATIVFSGEIRGTEIELTATTPDGVVTKGVARRSD